MRRHVVVQTAPSQDRAAGYRLPQLGYRAKKQVNLLLLASNDLVKLLHLFLGEGRLDFQIRQALVGCVGVCHAGGMMKSATDSGACHTCIY